MTDDRPGRGWTVAQVALFASIGGLVGADLLGDFRSGEGGLHLAAEGMAMVLALLAGGIGLRRLLDARRAVRSLEVELHATTSRLAATAEEASRWRKEAAEHLRGLSVAIDRQFDRWALTPAEREVGILLLKGLSHREIAGVRGTSEATARQQAQSLYRKAGLAGRTELSAFFLEDLLPAVGH